MILGVKVPMTGLTHNFSQVYIGPRVVERIIYDRRWKGRPGPFILHLRVIFRGAGPNSDGGYHRRQILHCAEFIQCNLAETQDRLTCFPKSSPAPTGQ